MLLALLCSCLLGLATAGDYGAPQATCQPSTSFITLTRTSLVAQPQQVTEYDYQYSHTTQDVTSVILLPTTVTQTQTCTDFAEPLIVTSTSFVTRRVFQTQYLTSLATDVVIQTSHILATNVEVEYETITQTAVVDDFVTNILTVTNHETAFRTLTLTNTVNQFFTETETRPFVVTETSYQTYTELATETVTSTSLQQVEATITVTEHDFVTRCHEPKITYDH